MSNLMLAFGAILPEEMIIEEIEKAISEHKLNPTKETKSKLSAYCMLFLSKEMIDDRGLDAMQKDLKEMERFKEVFKAKS